jgi:hypothetical protein
MGCRSERLDAAGTQSRRSSPDLERHNLRQIGWLNQRGERNLSIVDLIEAGTLTAEIAALSWLAIERGAGFVTGAVPGGAGKTTLMAALLAFLPPGEQIVTVEDRTVIQKALGGGVVCPATVLAHEIGSGNWYGYIWGRDAADFFALWRRGIRCVSCLHADTPEGASRMLRSLGVSDDDLERISLQVFMRAEAREDDIIRRVNSVECILGGRMRTLYRWRPAGDSIEAGVGRRELCGLLAAEYGWAQSEAQDRWEVYARCLERLQREGVREFGEVRRAILQAYGA